MENIQNTMNLLCKTLQTTRMFDPTVGNGLKELKVTADGKFVRPVFMDGAGEDGYYDVNIEGDSTLGAVQDVMKRFVNKM